LVKRYADRKKREVWDWYSDDGERRGEERR